MKIIVTNAHSRIAYRCMMALAKKGHEVVPGDFVPMAMSFYSRYASGKMIYPSPYKNPKLFFDFIINYAVKHKVDCIFPVHEESFVFSKYRSLVPKSIKIAVPDYDSILSVHNKDRFIDIVDKLGVPVPKNIIVDNDKDLVRKIDKIDYPVVLKPRQGGGNYGVKFVYDISNLKKIFMEHLRQLNLNYNQLQIQEYIPVGKKYSQVMLFRDGEYLTKFTDEHVRDYPIDGGAGCFRKSCEFPEMEKFTCKILKHLNWHGIAEAEYIVQKDTGIPYIIEINPRIWGGINSSISSGLDIPNLLFKIACDETIYPEEMCYQNNVKTKWFFGDLKTVGYQMKNSKNRVITLLNAINLFNNDIVLDEFCSDDPIPFLVHPICQLHTNFKRKKSSDHSLNGEWT